MKSCIGIFSGVCLHLRLARGRPLKDLAISYGDGDRGHPKPDVAGEQGERAGQRRGVRRQTTTPGRGPDPKSRRAPARTRARARTWNPWSEEAQVEDNPEEVQAILQMLATMVR